VRLKEIQIVLLQGAPRQQPQQQQLQAGNNMQGLSQFMPAVGQHQAGLPGQGQQNPLAGAGTHPY
jgi:hypothetical protein